MLPALEAGRSCSATATCSRRSPTRGRSCPWSGWRRSTRAPCSPDLTLFVEVTPSVAARRRAARGGPRGALRGGRGRSGASPEQYEAAIALREGSASASCASTASQALEAVTAACLAHVRKLLGRKPRAAPAVALESGAAWSAPAQRRSSSATRSSPRRWRTPTAPTSSGGCARWASRCARWRSSRTTWTPSWTRWRAPGAGRRYVFTSGGIGPTHDDVTVRAVALALGRPVVRLPEMVALIRERYGDARRPPEALRLADAPEGAVLLAPGGHLVPGADRGGHVPAARRAAALPAAAGDGAGAAARHAGAPALPLPGAGRERRSPPCWTGWRWTCRTWPSAPTRCSTRRWTTG